jgi:hypothetical protein
MPFEPLDEPAGLGRGKGLIERGWLVDVEIILHMTAPDPAAKEKAHEPTPEPAKKKGDELTTKELKGVRRGP